jgi:hypothetical protein
MKLQVGIRSEMRLLMLVVERSRQEAAPHLWGEGLFMKAHEIAGLPNHMRSPAPKFE